MHPISADDTLPETSFESISEMIAETLATMSDEDTPWPDVLAPERVVRWMGHRPGMPDTIPVIDRSPQHRNVTFAFGHGHMGLIGGSVTGKLISEMVAGKPTSIDVRPYSVTRF